MLPKFSQCRFLRIARANTRSALIRQLLAAPTSYSDIEPLLPQLTWPN